MKTHFNKRKIETLKFLFCVCIFLIFDTIWQLAISKFEHIIDSILDWIFLVCAFLWLVCFGVRRSVALPCHLAMAIAQCERLSAIWKSNEQETTDLIRWNIYVNINRWKLNEHETWDLIRWNIYVNINRWKLNEHETWDLIRWNITSTTKDRNQMSNRSSSIATRKLLKCSACKWCYFFFLSSSKKVKLIYWKTKTKIYIYFFEMNEGKLQR